MNLSSELAFLVSVLRKYPSVPAGLASHQLDGPLDWKEVLRLASWHGVLPVVYRQLKCQPGATASIPQEELAAMERACYANLAWNMHLHAELTRVLEFLNDRDVSVIVLKGLALAELYYPSIADRRSYDLDLLVRKEALDQTRAHLEHLGYRCQPNKPVDWHLRNDYHIPYFHPEKKILLELHWHIARQRHPGRLAILDNSLVDDWWNRAEKVQLADSRALSLSPEDLVFYLSIHFVRHRFAGTKNFSSRLALVQLLDVSRVLVVSRERFRWEYLRELARKYEVEDMVALVLYFVDKSFDPPGLRHALQSFPLHLDSNPLELIERRMLTPETALPAVPASLSQSLRLAWNLLFPDQEAMCRHHGVEKGSPMLWLYYLTWPFELLLKHRNLLRHSPRLREDLILNRWIWGHGSKP